MNFSLVLKICDIMTFSVSYLLIFRLAYGLWHMAPMSPVPRYSLPTPWKELSRKTQYSTLEPSFMFSVDKLGYIGKTSYQVQNVFQTLHPKMYFQDLS